MPTAYWKTNLTHLQGIFSRSLIIHPSMAALHLCPFSGGLPAWRRWGIVPKCSWRGHEAQQILLQSKVKKISLLTLYTSLSFEVKYYLSIWPVQLVRAHLFHLMMGFEVSNLLSFPVGATPKLCKAFVKGNYIQMPIFGKDLKRSGFQSLSLQR